MFIRNERSIKEFRESYPIVFWLVVINLVLWLIIDFLRLPFAQDLYAWGIGFNAYIGEGQIWRLITPIFLHSGFTHVLFNSFALVLFGPALEQMLGKYKFLAAYFGAGVIANIVTYILESPLYAHVGASGAIFGLFGVYAFMVVFRKHLIDYASSRIIMPILIIALVMTFLRSGINIYGHLFGFIGGFILAPLVLHNVQPYSPWVRRRSVPDDGTIQFNPDRWNKKKIIPPKVKKNLIWIIIGVLAIWGLLSQIL